MAALFDEIVSSLSSRVTVRSIAEEAPGADVPSLGTAAVLAVPAIIVRLTHSLTDQGVSRAVLQHLAAIDPAAETSAGSSVDPSADRAVGGQVVNLIFGDDTGHVVDSIADEADIGRDQAAAVLPTSAWLVLTSVAKQYGNQLDNPSLVTVLDRERRDLMTKGWAPWIEKVSRDVPAEPAPRAVPPPTTDRPGAKQVVAPPTAPGATGTTQHFASPADAGAVAAETASPTVPMPTRPTPAVQTPATAPLATPAAHTQNIASPADAPLASAMPPAHTDLANRRAVDFEPRAAASPRPSAATDEWSQARLDEPRRSNEREPANKRFSFLSLLAGALLMLGVLALIGWFQSRGDSETNVADSGVLTDDNATDDSDAASGSDSDESGTATDGYDSEDPAGDTTDDSESAAPAAPAAGEPQLAYSIQMDDPLQRSDASGLVNLEFDEEAGQVCYDVETTGLGEPYDGHIHVGPAGVKGGIVVDFGPVTSGVGACTDVAANDMAAILAQPGAHYVEMHDPTEEFTIRAQMSDEPVPTVAGSVDFNPDGDGATTQISAGRITLEGPVPDQETMDRMIAEVAGLDESRILVVNDLVVTEGADLPTGRITVADSILFAVDSDELGASNQVIEDLALLFTARPEWTMSIVGHTDSTGNDVYNLELSLRRAAAVRDALAGLGVDAARLRTEGLGARDPVASNDTESGRAQNRRIEFRIDRS